MCEPFYVSLTVWAKSQDSVRKTPFLERKESRSGSNRHIRADVKGSGWLSWYSAGPVIESCGFVSRQERWEKFSSPELTVYANSYSVSVPPPTPIPALPQWHAKDTCLYTKSARGRLHLITHTPLTQRSRSGLTMP